MEIIIKNNKSITPNIEIEIIKEIEYIDNQLYDDTELFYVKKILIFNINYFYINTILDLDKIYTSHYEIKNIDDILEGKYKIKPEFLHSKLTGTEINLNLFYLNKYMEEKQIKISKSWSQITKSIDENNIYINPKLKPTVEISYIDGSPINSGEPGDIIKLFVENHYDVIREAFPIYKELEIIYKIMCANRIMRQNFVVPQKATLVYVGDIMDSIMFHGGINLQPKNWNIIDMPVIPFVEVGVLG